MKGKTRHNMVILSLMIATFLMAIEGTIVSTAIPKIVEDLHESHLYTWVISIYLLATVISTPIFGKLADLYGRKAMFTVGIIIFLIGSTMAGFSQSMQQLIIFRLIQGIGAGALTTIPFTIIGDIFPIEQRGKVQGFTGSIWGISGIIGPIVGGFIVDTISWRWIFLMNIPFGVIAILILAFSLYEQIEKKKQIIDYPGIIVFTISMTSLLYGLTLLKEQHQLTGKGVLFFVITLLGLGLFIWVEKNAKEPMLPLTLFKNRLFNISNLSSFLLCFIYVVSIYYIPLWAQGISDLNATYSGIAVMPMSLTWPVAGILIGKKFANSTFRRYALMGVVVILVGSFGLAIMQADTTLLWLMLVSAVLGFGFGLALTTFTVVVQSSFDWHQRGAAMGAHNLMKNLGETIGIAVSGLWLSDQLYGRELEIGLHSVFILLVVLAVLAIGITILLTSSNKQESVSVKVTG